MAWLMATIFFGAVLCIESRNRQFLALTTALAIMEIPVPSSIAFEIDAVDTATAVDATEAEKDTHAASASTPTSSTTLPASCPLSASSFTSSAPSFLAHVSASHLLHEYVNATIESGKKPRFPPILQKLLEYASEHDQYFVTVQIGGMDGKTGDPLYRMTELYRKSLKYWVPIVLEPVSANFVKLHATYATHQEQRGLLCPLLLNSLISYANVDDAAATDTCDFCHFDNESEDPACHDMPNWKKSEIGSMDCSRNVVEKGACFTKSQLECGTIKQSTPSFLSANLMVLQVDVEGFEQQVLEGFLQERVEASLPLPPVIHFESRILRTRHTLEPLNQLLRSYGYSLHEKRVDTLCILGYEGHETSVL
jgi:hypothetical protein